MHIVHSSFFYHPSAYTSHLTPHTSHLTPHTIHLTPSALQHLTTPASQEETSASQEGLQPVRKRPQLETPASDPGSGRPTPRSQGQGPGSRSKVLGLGPSCQARVPRSHVPDLRSQFQVPGFRSRVPGPRSQVPIPRSLVPGAVKEVALMRPLKEAFKRVLKKPITRYL